MGLPGGLFQKVGGPSRGFIWESRWALRGGLFQKLGGPSRGFIAERRWALREVISESRWALREVISESRWALPGVISESRWALQGVISESRWALRGVIWKSKWMISADWFSAAPLHAAPSVPAGCFAVWFHLTVASASHHHTHYFLLLPLRLCTRVNPALVSLLSALLRSLPAVLSLASPWGDTRPTLIILSVTKVVTETMIMMRAHILFISIYIKCGCIYNT